MLLAITSFELSSGQIYIQKYPFRISGRISGRIIILNSDFHQYFKSTLYIHPASFSQIGWIWGNFIRPDIRPDIWIFTKIYRSLCWHLTMNPWKSHDDSCYRSWIILLTHKVTKSHTPHSIDAVFARRFATGANNKWLGIDWYTLKLCGISQPY